MEERFADIQMLRYCLKDFDTLSLQQKLFIYCLSQATLWGRDITFDQFGRYNIRIRRLLEAIYYNKTSLSGSSDTEDAALMEYLKRVWFSNGIYHHYSCRKMMPSFSKEYFIRQVKAIPQNQLPLDDEESVDEMLDTLIPVIFDPDVLPQRVNHADGEDLVMSSACNLP